MTYAQDEVELDPTGGEVLYVEPAPLPEPLGLEWWLAALLLVFWVARRRR